MNNFSLSCPKKIEIITDDKVMSFESDNIKYDDIELSLIKNGDACDIYLKANKTPIKHIYLYYPILVNEDTLLYGDTLERAYADLSWSKKQDRLYFWYLLLNDTKKKELFSIGSKVQPSSIVLFNIKEDSLRIDLNVCNGADGVILNNRKILAASLITKNEKYDNLLDACRNFCRLMMGEVPIYPLNEKILGFNNWYYAYGNSSYSQIIDDTKLLKEVTKECSIKPFMVVDDCWSIYSCAGPWLANEKFVDMAKLAREIKKLGARPGIWIRPLRDLSDNLKNCRHPRNKECLDFTYKETVELVKNTVKTIVNDGYELIKFDFVTGDIFQLFTFQMDENLAFGQDWHFANRNITNAEIILSLYKTIKEAAGNAILIGCNAVSHLAAGLVQINRVGDDTSGNKWERTRDFGVNTLAFRLMQDKIFYVCDADCVGIMGEEIPWKQNRLWLHLLANSNTPLFVSCDPCRVTDEMKKDLKTAFLDNEKDNKCEPISWLNEKCPSIWKINDKEIEFDWYMFDK